MWAWTLHTDIDGHVGYMVSGLPRVNSDADNDSALANSSVHPCLAQLAGRISRTAETPHPGACSDFIRFL